MKAFARYLRNENSRSVFEASAEHSRIPDWIHETESSNGYAFPLLFFNFAGVRRERAFIRLMQARHCNQNSLT